MWCRRWWTSFVWLAYGSEKCSPWWIRYEVENYTSRSHYWREGYIHALSSDEKFSCCSHAFPGACQNLHNSYVLYIFSLEVLSINIFMVYREHQWCLWVTNMHTQGMEITIVMVMIMPWTIFNGNRFVTHNSIGHFNFA